jgi:hypothetical protein
VGGAGSGGNHLSSAELYDPTSGTWTVTNAMSTARGSHTATLLTSGEGLVAGGFEAKGNSTASAELYDPGKLKTRFQAPSKSL